MTLKLRSRLLALPPPHWIYTTAEESQKRIAKKIAARGDFAAEVAERQLLAAAGIFPAASKPSDGTIFPVSMPATAAHNGTRRKVFATGNGPLSR